MSVNYCIGGYRFSTGNEINALDRASSFTGSKCQQRSISNRRLRPVPSKGMEMPFYRAEDTLNPFYWWFDTQDMFYKMFYGKVLKPLSSYYVCSSCTYYFTTVYCFSGTRITFLDDMDHYLSRRSRTQFIRLNGVHSSNRKRKIAYLKITLHYKFWGLLKISL